MELLEILNEYGFATMSAIAMGWFIWFIYTFITQEVTKKLSEASAALISLIDKIRKTGRKISTMKYLACHLQVLGEKKK